MTVVIITVPLIVVSSCEFSQERTTEKERKLNMPILADVLYKRLVVGEEPPPRPKRRVE